MFSNLYKDKSVLLTGHTGFKGSWLSEWLLSLGAKVHGIALNPQVDQPLFDMLSLTNRLESDSRFDIRDLDTLVWEIKKIKPTFIFHLAAQALVRLSYTTPVETFSTNIMGTANVLEAVRLSGHPCAVVIITTDKCYENKEWLYGYREEDAMGGNDPYSASKGCAELVVNAYRHSYFNKNVCGVKIASARAGNVIGGGDWAVDRIIPDTMRAILANKPVKVRNKTATRPWQHVLEPLSGYLWLGACLTDPKMMTRNDSDVFTSGFNFGPTITSNRTVSELVTEFLKYFQDSTWEDQSIQDAVHEASKLNLAIDKAYHLIGWQPVWDFKRTVEETAKWYSVVSESMKADEYIQKQITDYYKDALQKGLPWATLNKIN